LKIRFSGDAYDISSSVRSINKFGRMIIDKCNISKECISSYIGSSLPNWQGLGLSPERLYYIYRPAEELIRAAESFNGVPVTIEHPDQLDTPDNPQERVGTTGTDTRFESPYLVTSMCLWDKDAIDGVESDTRRELSIFPSFFDLDMTPGEFMGQSYDGIARNIVGNSVALTIQGRIGAECAIGDSLSNEDKVMDGLADLIKGKFATASDSDVEELVEDISKLVKGDEYKDDEDKSGDEEDGKEIGDEDEDEEKKGDEEDEKKTMGDSAIKALIARTKKEALADAQRDFAATREAMRTVEPVFGHVAGDSASDIYKAVLKQEKINFDGVHPSAYKPLVEMAIRSRKAILHVGDSSNMKQVSESDFKEYF
jgi:uncharacterized protein